ncbi:MAG: aminopeptidase P family N-terminal domain-containing protein, partial [Eubacteriales bacterium]|nr:aminopeptidase P family N-terminal domain-containing protein [Eubacteriales bacterium]
MTTNEKVNKIRSLFKRDGINAYIIPNSDPHVSEYIPDFYRFRTFVSGFTGSAGSVIISDNKSGLWTDGRYFTQAENQLSGSEIELYRMAVKGVPTIPEFLGNELPENGVLGMDGNLMSVKSVNDILKAGKKKNVSIKADLDYAAEIWTDGSRPAKPASEIYEYEIKYAGESTTDKIKRLREKCEDKAILVTKLDSIAWLFNLRADDIAYNPVALAYGLVTPDKAYIFTDSC